MQACALAQLTAAPVLHPGEAGCLTRLPPAPMLPRLNRVGKWLAPLKSPAIADWPTSIAGTMISLAW